METDKTAIQFGANKLALRPKKRTPSPQQQAEQESDADRFWRESIALNRYGARTEDYIFAGRKH